MPCWSTMPPQVTYLSYQTLTIDLYAPLLLLVLLFSLMFTLLSCSCSRLSDQYRLATAHARYWESLNSWTALTLLIHQPILMASLRPQSEHRTREDDATTILARWHPLPPFSYRPPSLCLLAYKGCHHWHKSTHYTMSQCLWAPHPLALLYNWGYLF